MPGFCVSCGSPLTGPFCNQCGARAVPPGGPAQSLPAVPQSPPVQAGFQAVNIPVSSAPPAQAGYQPVKAPTMAPPKSSGLGKILLWIGAIVLVLFIAGVGAVVYGAYWVKHKVAKYESAITAGSSDSVKVVAKGDSCRLLSTQELQKVLGVTVEKSAEILDDGQPGCAYYTDPQSVMQLQKMALAQQKRDADAVNGRPGPKPDNLPSLMKNANQLEGVVKALGMTQPPGDGRVFSFTLQRGVDADAWSGMRLTEAAVPGFEEVSGVGDHAMIGAFGHAFYVMKGDAVITMSMMFVPDARMRGSEIGKKILGRL